MQTAVQQSESKVRQCLFLQCKFDWISRIRVRIRFASRKPISHLKCVWTCISNLPLLWSLCDVSMCPLDSQLASGRGVWCMPHPGSPFSSSSQNSSSCTDAFEVEDILPCAAHEGGKIWKYFPALHLGTLQCLHFSAEFLCSVTSQISFKQKTRRPRKHLFCLYGSFIGLTRPCWCAETDRKCTELFWILEERLTAVSHYFNN